MDEILQAHLDLCDRLYAIILEENHILKATNAAPEESFLARKREILVPLEESTCRLRTVNTRERKTEQQRSLIEKAQRTIMKTLLIDRENEQLLLKQGDPSRRTAAPTPVPSINHLKRLYMKHA